jgi:hypothetical protein
VVRIQEDASPIYLLQDIHSHPKAHPHAYLNWYRRLSSVWLKSPVRKTERSHVLQKLRVSGTTLSNACTTLWHLIGKFKFLHFYSSRNILPYSPFSTSFTDFLHSIFISVSFSLKKPVNFLTFDLIYFLISRTSISCHVCFRSKSMHKNKKLIK